MDSFDASASLSALRDGEAPRDEQSSLLAGGTHARGMSETSFFVGRSSPKRSAHHRRRTSVSEAVKFRLGTIADGMKEAASDVKTSFRMEMEDANEGRVTFLDTSMIRSLSVLPEDLEVLLGEAVYDYFHDESSTQDSDERAKMDAAVSTPPGSAPFSLAPYLALLGAVLAVSSNGPSLAILAGVPPPLIQYWRMLASAMALTGHTFLIFRKDGLPTLTVGQCTTMGLAVTCYVFQNICFTTAITYTSVSNVVVFANSQALILLAGKALTGGTVLWIEAAGAVVAFSGAVLCASDDQTAASDVEKTADMSILGDCFAMASAVLGVGYLTFAKAVRSSNIGVIPFTWFMMLSGSFIVLLYMAITQEPFTVSANPDNGLFGWMSPRWDRLGVELWIVLVVNCVGTMGFVRAMGHFEPVTIAIATLLEPMCATFIAFGVHVGYLPGIRGWIGNLVVAAGTLAVVYPSANKGGGGGH